MLCVPRNILLLLTRTQTYSFHNCNLACQNLFLTKLQIEYSVLYHALLVALLKSNIFYLKLLNESYNEQSFKRTVTNPYTAIGERNKQAEHTNVFPSSR